MRLWLAQRDLATPAFRTFRACFRRKKSAISQIDSVKFTAAALLEFAQIAAAVWISEIWWNPVVYALAVVVIGSRINGLGALMHDTAHYRAANFADDQNAGNFVALTWNSFATDSAARWAVLRRFLDAGGSALIVPSVGAPAQFGSPPDWLASMPGGLQSATNGLALTVLDKTHAMFNEIRDENGVVGLHNVKVFDFVRCDLRPTPRRCSAWKTAARC